MQTSTVVAAFDFVACKYTSMIGKPVGVVSTASTSPIQKRNVISQARAIMLFRTTAQFIAAGTFLGGSVISSLRCNTPSKPTYQVLGSLGNGAGNVLG